MRRDVQLQITLSDQPRLGLGRTARIAVDGVRYRLFRAAVTVSVIAVAVAFLTNILSESLIKRQLAADARQELADMRLVHVWAARLSYPAEPETILAAVAAGETPDFLASVGDADARTRFVKLATTAARYLAFFDRLNYDQRRTLLHTTAGVTIFDKLRTPDGWARFESALADMPAVRLGEPLEGLRQFLDEWPAAAAGLDAITAAQSTAIERLTARRGSQSVFAALAGTEGAFTRAAQEAGFQLDDETRQRLAVQAQAVIDRQVIERTLSELESRQLLAQHFDLLPADVSPDQLWHYLENVQLADTYLKTITPVAPGLKAFTAARLAELAVARDKELALARVERLTVGAGSGWLGMGDRRGWLLCVSLLVCAIGITNAMLMSVTERYREIATMKCLGALDGFIMLLFVIESCCLGLAGGVVGALLGDLIGYGRMAVAFGMGVFTAVPTAELLTAMVAAVGVGVVLAAVAAIYPSLKAARLAPMEAMRVE